MEPPEYEIGRASSWQSIMSKIEKIENFIPIGGIITIHYLMSINLQDVAKLRSMITLKININYIGDYE